MAACLIFRRVLICWVILLASFSLGIVHRSVASASEQPRKRVNIDLALKHADVPLRIAFPNIERVTAVVSASATSGLGQVQVGNPAGKSLGVVVQHSLPVSADGLDRFGDCGEGSRVANRATSLTDRTPVIRGDQVLRSQAFDRLVGGCGSLVNLHVYDAPVLLSVLRAGMATNNAVLYRRSANVGEFGDLPEAMQLRNVRSAAAEGGVGLDGVRVRIIRDPALKGKGVFGYTHPDGRTIDLYPDAFSSRSALIETLGHERTHVYQIRTFGPATSSAQVGAYESGAYAVEGPWTKHAGSQ
jgi:hypothetical protein